MAETKGKSKSPALFIIVAFMVIIILMVIANSRESLLTLLEPSPGGIESLYTAGDQLVAISVKQEIFIWDWKQLDLVPVKAKVKASNVVYYPPDKLFWVPRNSPRTVVVSNLEGDKINKRISFGGSWVCKLMKRSSSGKFIAFMLVSDLELNNGNVSVRFSVFDSEAKRAVSKIFTIDLAKDEAAVNEIVVANNGDYLSFVGRKKNSGWAGLIDVKAKKLLWERNLETTKELTEVTFSADSKSIYFGGPGRVVYELDTASGKALYEYEMGKSELPNKKQYVTCITVTDNGKYMATCTWPSSVIHIFDAETNEVVQKIGGGGKTTRGGVGINTLAFSRENDMIAAGDMTPIRKVKIFRSTKTK